MRLIPWRKQPEQKSAQFEQLLMRLIAAQEGIVGEFVTPDSCLASPTVHAIDTAINRRMAVTPVHVYRKTSVNGRDIKQKEPNHPVAKLLARPNAWQTYPDFISDAASTWLRHGKFYAWKAQGSTGPVQELVPLSPTQCRPKLDDLRKYYFEIDERGGRKDYPPSKILHVRGRAKDFVEGDSPIKNIQTAIMMEILAEKFGESFFRNGAMPLQIFQYMQGFRPFKTAEEEQTFVDDFKKAFSGSKRFNAMIVPFGIESKDPIRVENDKAQFIESRKYQRTVICGGLGAPVHLAGDLERATFNNLEQQDQDFTMGMVMPVAKAFEAAFERDLLTEEDRASGIVIRFNLDSTLRADFKSRQEGLKIQREMGAINANEWREVEGRNPIDEGDTYWTQGPSGQGMNDANT